MRLTKKRWGVLVPFLTLALVGPTYAITVALTFPNGINNDPTDCPGAFSPVNPDPPPPTLQAFNQCVLTGSLLGIASLPSSRVIAKWDVESDGIDETNGLFFPSISGDEFDVVGAGMLGTWTYAPDDPEDPGILYWVAKAGNSFTVFFEDGPAMGFDPVPTTSGGWSTIDLGANLSHLTFYNGAGGQMPEPGSLALMGIALGAIAVWRRRRSVPWPG